MELDLGEKSFGLNSNISGAKVYAASMPLGMPKNKKNKNSCVLFSCNFCLLIYNCLYTAVSRNVVQLKSIKAYATIPKGMMGCGCSLLDRQVHEFSARWKVVL